jgi:hypothetical protein
MREEAVMGATITGIPREVNTGAQVSAILAKAVFGNRKGAGAPEDAARTAA